eukprot:g18384.t1
MPEGDKVLLKSSQGEIFEVEPEVACMSTLVRNMVDDSGTDEEIPLPNVKTAILSKGTAPAFDEGTSGNPGQGRQGDLGGLCVALRSISSRTEQLEVKVTTKSKDNVFCTVHISVQIYKLANVSDQIDAFVANIIRSKVPNMDIDDAFEAKDDLSSAITQELAATLAPFGFVVHNVLCTEIRLHKSVMDAMNEINRD